MTETTPVGTSGGLRAHMGGWPDDKKYDVRSKQGWPAPFVEIRLMRPEGEAPWDGVTSGEIEIRGPWVAASYYESPDQAHRWTEDGWFRTGDVATVDEDGYVKIVDRAKDLVKSGGEWISSVDLENALMGHPAVKEACVVGIPHPKWQERPLAAVVLKDGARATPEELRAFLAESFAKWQLPDAFVFLEAILVLPWASSRKSPSANNSPTGSGNRSLTRHGGLKGSPIPRGGFLGLKIEAFTRAHWYVEPFTMSRLCS